jgi:hypothetical protein
MSNREEEEEEFYRQKYLKYKAKYLEAKSLADGGQPTGISTGDVTGIKTKSCGDISGRANCSLSKDCKWDAGETKTATKEGRLPSCLDKPCKDYWSKTTCPVNSKEAEARKPENKCRWTGDGTKNFFGKEKGDCVNA